MTRTLCSKRVKLTLRFRRVVLALASDRETIPTIIGLEGVRADRLCRSLRLEHSYQRPKTAGRAPPLTEQAPATARIIWNTIYSVKSSPHDSRAGYSSGDLASIELSARLNEEVASNSTYWRSARTSTGRFWNASINPTRAGSS
jgi:hypothetical protein